MRFLLEISSALYGLVVRRMLIRISFCSLSLSLCVSPSVTPESPAESESNLESDSDGSEDDMKERGETEADSDAERTPVKLSKESSSSHKSSSTLSANCSLLNLQIIKPPSLPRSLLTPTTVTTSGALSNHSTQSPPFTFATLPGIKHNTIQLQFTITDALMCDSGFRKVLLTQITKQDHDQSQYGIYFSLTLFCW